MCEKCWFIFPSFINKIIFEKLKSIPQIIVNSETIFVYLLVLPVDSKRDASCIRQII